MSAVFKRELHAYFTTPIGYVFGALFLALTNWFFYLYNVVYLSASLSSVFFVMLVLLTLTTPILTMRLFSEEYRQKTDQLLLTAPVRPIEIVLGKFFSAFGVVAAVLACTLIFPLVVAIHGAPNGAEIAGGYLAILCAAAAFIAIGLFVSSLTESQMLALLGTIGLFVLLLLLLLVRSSIPASWAWLHAFIAWFSPYTRFSSFTQGIFPLNDLLFYVSLTALFLFLSARLLEKKRWA
ncbi:MAG: ABC transporter permease [Oscillospiraceae bacterium]|jgi:ABC-2 type transport system permease protein|nr:ABC transporter permease [Oscillospiraceae bacterium]